MDYSSGEDLPIKTRKPYTISKQRERWTEEEHNRFLEALKLYGRAWQKIEEHIGTKTAVQIRSHAQKFFTKLEKEALAKGVPKALDIEIPPPRPKRKPTNPYPRKTGLALHEKPDGEERTERCCNDSQNENDCSEVLNLFQGASSTSSPTMAPRRSHTFREFVPMRKTVPDDGKNNKLSLETELENPFQSENINENSQPDNCGEFSSNDMQTTNNYPKHAPVHVLNPNLGTNIQNVSLDMPSQETVFHGHHPKQYFSYTETAPISANTQHFDQFHSNNQDNYQAYIQASSAFSGLIVSTLLQNPAAHAAAAFAASFWPSADPFSTRRENLPPSMAAIAAATVAAATAWWTTHGLLLSPPPPLHNGFNINQSSVSAVINVADKRENEISSQDQQHQAQQSPLKSPVMSSSESEKSEGANKNGNNEEATDTTIAADPNNTTSVKQVDRSSCGSNTPSGSEVETDALKMEKTEEGVEREGQPDDSDFNNCRGCRSSFITSDSWKEVSEEGRLAFQALFSREVLPQSFLSPNDMRNKGYNQTKNIDKNDKVEDAMELDLNSNMCENDCTGLRSESNEKLLQWTMGIGQGKLKVRGTGFKPYKRLKIS